jgi:hypothetical protein
MAGVAGCLLLIGNDTYTEASQLMTPALGILVFTATAVGGLGAATGAVIGAALIEGSSVFLPPSWQPLPAGLGILLVLLAFPEGLSGPLFRARDRLVLWVAIRTRAIPLDVADALERTLTQRFAAAAAGQPPDPGDTVP